VNDYSDLRDLVESAEALPIPQPEEVAGPITLAECAKLEQNDTDNGRRLILHFGEDLLFADEIGWHAWHRNRWQRRGGDRVVQILAQRTAKRIRFEARHLAHTQSEERAIAGGDDKARGEAEAALAKRREGRHRFGISSGNDARIAAMLRQALPHCSVTPDELDVDPLAFNVENGTLRFAKILDMQNEHPDDRYTLGVTLSPHQRTDRITKLAPCAFDPKAECPAWLAFLERFQPDPAVRRFLQVYHGLALTGLAGDQVFVFNHGTGANGKSTFVEALSQVFGDYGELLNAESLVGQGQRRGDQATPDFAILPGVRFLRVSELPRGEPLREALVKTLTGGEPIQARHLNKGFFKFTPVFKAAMSGNDFPEIKGGDHGIWRRIRFVSWGVKISDHERRPMNEVLAEFAAERSGILNWLIQGLRIYFEEGLTTPAAVVASTEYLRDNMDPLSNFIRDCIRPKPGHKEQARTVHQAFVTWCLANNERPWKETAFGRAFPHKGFTRGTMRQGRAEVRAWLDVELVNVPDRPDREPSSAATYEGGADDGER
jgi:putative DNA primase/helicase